MNRKRKIIIQPSTILEAEEIFNFIKPDSPQNAQKFRVEFLSSVNKVAEHPDAYPPEKDLNNKIILYRFILVMKKWKLIYKVTKNIIIFVGIVHTSRHPNEIKKLRTKNY